MKTQEDAKDIEMPPPLSTLPYKHAYARAREILRLQNRCRGGTGTETNRKRKR